MNEENLRPAMAGDDEDIGALDIALVLAQNLRMLVILPLVVGLLAFGLTFLVTPRFTATAQMLPPQQQSTASALLGSLGGLAGALSGGSGGGGIAGLKNPADQWVGMLQSRTIADALVDRFKLRELYDTEFQFQARDKLAKYTRISAGKDGIIDLEVDDVDPKRAAGLAEGYMTELQVLTKALAISEAEQRRQFFEGQLKEAKDNLVKAEIELKGGGINASVLKLTPDGAIAELAQFRAQVAILEVRVATMKGFMTEASPELKQARLELESLQAQLAKAEKADPALGQTEGAQYVERYRNFKYYETLFELLARQYELARADVARDGAAIQVVDHAQVPEWKSSPKRGLISVVSAVATLFLYIAFLMTRQALRKARLQPAVSTKLDRLSAALRPWRRQAT